MFRGALDGGASVAAKIMQLVNDLIGQGRWDEAHSVLIRYAQQQPGDPQIEFQLGNLCFNTGKLADAERHYKTTLSANNNFTEAHYRLGLTLMKDGRPAEAMACFREACEQNAGFAVGHLHWGLALSQMGSYRGAIGQYSQAIKLAPQMVVAYYQAGVASHQLGLYEDALNYFQQAGNMDPQLAEAFNGQGITLCALSRPADAIAMFERAWQLNNNLGAVKRNWASALVGLGKVDEAARHYQEAINLAPKILDAKERALIYNDWAVILFQQGRTEEAADKLRQAVDVDPGLAAARVNLGMVHNSLGEHDLAAESFDKALDASPEDGEICMHSGIACLFQRRYDDALERFAQAQAKGFKSTLMNLWMGYAQIALGHLDVAERHFQKAAEEDGQNYLVYDGWGLCLALMGRHGEALDRYAQCLQIKPVFGLCHLHAARSLEALGRANESKGEYRIAVQQDPACLSPEKEALEKLIAVSQFDLVLSKSLKLLEIAPSDLDAQLAMAKALKAQNRHGECLDVLNSLIKEHPDCGPAFGLIAQVHLAQGNLVEADERFRAASLLFEGDAPLYFAWGKTLTMLGLHELALEKFQKSSEIDPYDSDVYESWGATLKSLGRFQEAAEVYKRAAEYI